VESGAAMSAKSVYLPHPSVVERSHVSTLEKYKELYEKSIKNPEEFWAPILKEFHWETPYTPGKFCTYNFDITKGPIEIKWLEGATTNICYNLLDRNIRNGNGDKVAFYW